MKFEYLLVASAALVVLAGCSQNDQIGAEQQSFAPGFTNEPREASTTPAAAPPPVTEPAPPVAAVPAPSAAPVPAPPATPSETGAVAPPVQPSTEVTNVPPTGPTNPDASDKK